ncbi:metal dependent phosphohydrolase [Hoeflea marina]|uniref:Metal dependent phosphohydrolase n=2 Tax=Hoeflea marina TaxID=274592 RepID=A0A317PLW6_9HYPH|nr:metal dependent phosphohydrolase [Hoeflea marina]
MFAARAHDGETRQDAGDAYVNHLAEVACICAGLEPFDPVLVAACYLHDAIEDTAVTETVLRAEFGDEIADLVMDVTDPPDLKGRERRERQVSHTAAAGPRVKRLKLADKISNVEELIGIQARRFKVKANARYLDWARRVVDVCRDVEPALDARFDASARRLEAEIDRHRTRKHAHDPR